MAAIYLEIFFLILGLTGLLNASFISEDFDWNKRYSPHRFDYFQRKNYYFRNRFGEPCRNLYGIFPCNNNFKYPNGFDYDPSDFENPYFKHYWPLESDENSDENTNEDGSYTSSKNAISSTQRSNAIETHTIDGHNFFNYFRTISSDKSANSYSNSRIPLTPSSTTVNFSSDLTVTEQNVPTFKISLEKRKSVTETETISNSEISQKNYRTLLEPEYKPSLKKESLGLIEDQSTFLPQTLENSSKGLVSPIIKEETESSPEFVTDAFTKSERVESTFFDKRTDGSTFSEDDSISSDSTAPETKRSSNYIFSTIKTSSSHKILVSKEEIFETESTTFQDISSAVTKEATPFDGKSSTLDGIQSTNNQDTEIMSTVSQSPSFSTTDKETSLKILSSSGGIHLTEIQSVETESIISQSSTSDDTILQSKLSTAVATKSTETLENESSTKNAISSSKVPLTPLTDKVSENNIKEISSTESSSSKDEITPVAITQDHVIEIPSIRKARIVITAVFLVIALTAFIVLAVYIFGIKRKTEQYDQLLLIS